MTLMTTFLVQVLVFSVLLLQLLQCCSFKIGSTKVKNYVYIYININIEVFVGYGGNTSRELQQLQHCNNEPPLAASYGYCFLFICFVAPFFKNHAKQKNSSEGFVNRKSPFVLLHCQKKKGEQMTPARTSPALMINAPGVSVIHAASSG